MVLHARVRYLDSTWYGHWKSVLFSHAVQPQEPKECRSQARAAQRPSHTVVLQEGKDSYVYILFL